MGPKQAQFLTRLRGDGIPTDEATRLLHEVHLEESQEAEARISANTTFKDPRAQRLSDSWKELGSTATTQQKDAVANADIVYCLGLPPETAERFLEHDHAAYDAVGLRQGATVHDCRGFWEAVSHIFPGSFQPEDIEFLAEEGGYDATRHFRGQLEAWGESSDGLYSLLTNAHVYK